MNKKFIYLLEKDSKKWAIFEHIGEDCFSNICLHLLEIDENKDIILDTPSICFYDGADILLSNYNITEIDENFYNDIEQKHDIIYQFSKNFENLINDDFIIEIDVNAFKNELYVSNSLFDIIDSKKHITNKKRTEIPFHITLSN